MNCPVTNFYVVSNEDAAYICFLAKSIVNNFYQNSGIYVLPYAIKDGINTCYFPDLDYPLHFWKLIKSNKNAHFKGSFPLEAFNIVSRALEKNNLIKDINMNRNSIASHWKQKELISSPLFTNS